MAMEGVATTIELGIQNNTHSALTTSHYDIPRKITEAVAPTCEHDIYDIHRKKIETVAPIWPDIPGQKLFMYDHSNLSPPCR
jgi:hypothetical protein